MPPPNPFLEPPIPAGHGTVHLSLLPPSLPTLSTLSYRYPLKLLTRTPAVNLASTSKFPETASTPVHLYILTYGGGLLPGDHIAVDIKVCRRARMVIATPQGSQKIYKTEGQKRQLLEGDGKGDDEGEGGGELDDTDREDGEEEEKELGGKDDTERSTQSLSVHLEPFSALCYLPDPTVPYSDSQYEQVQRFYMHQTSGNPSSSSSSHEPGSEPSLCMLDWVTQGRSARGEDWSFRSWRGKNEIISLSPEDLSPSTSVTSNPFSLSQTKTKPEEGKKKTGKRKGRLLLRDNIILEADPPTSNLKGGDRELTRPLSIRHQVHSHGIIGTLTLYGPVFEDLAEFFMGEYRSLPRIGGRNWNAHSSSSTTSSVRPGGTAAAEEEEKLRRRKKLSENVTWTAARVRDKFVLIKFGAKDFESAREWLGEMVRREGSIEREFGEEGYGCL